MKNKILFIYFDSYMKNILNDEGVVFDNDFFSSERWPSKPNSTSRLSIANFQAMSYLEGEFDIVNKFISTVDDEFLESFDLYDKIIFNQVASVASHDCIRRIIDYCIDKSISNKLIFGTEVTWFSELKKDVFDKKHLDFIYYHCTLLRHTAKTDREVYLKDFLPPKIVEFELGVDTDVLKPKNDISVRKYITFVLGPEGRVTKNNDLIFSIIEELKLSDVLKNLEVKVVSPPYSSVELWDIFDDSVFFVFTSNSETFSYVLNDAKAKGVITLYPSHMYCNFIGRQFCVQSYPESSLRYTDVQHAIDLMEGVYSFPDSLRKNSELSRDFVLNNFSITALMNNWRAIFRDESLNNNKAYLLSSSGDDFKTYEDLTKFCADEGFRYVITYNNNLDIIPEFHDFSYYDSESDIVILKFLYTKVEDEIFRIVDFNMVSPCYGVVVEAKKESFDEVYRFFSLLKRINKIDRIYTSENFYNISTFSKLLNVI